MPSIYAARDSWAATAMWHPQVLSTLMPPNYGSNQIESCGRPIEMLKERELDLQPERLSHTLCKPLRAITRIVFNVIVGLTLAPVGILGNGCKALYFAGRAFYSGNAKLWSEVDQKLQSIWVDFKVLCVSAVAVVIIGAILWYFNVVSLGLGTLVYASSLIEAIFIGALFVLGSLAFGIFLSSEHYSQFIGCSPEECTALGYSLLLYSQLGLMAPDGNLLDFGKWRGQDDEQYVSDLLAREECKLLELLAKADDVLGEIRVTNGTVWEISGIEELQDYHVNWPSIKERLLRDRSYRMEVRKALESWSTDMKTLKSENGEKAFCIYRNKPIDPTGFIQALERELPKQMLIEEIKNQQERLNVLLMVFGQLGFANGTYLNARDVPDCFSYRSDSDYYALNQLVDETK